MAKQGRRDSQVRMGMNQPTNCKNENQWGLMKTASENLSGCLRNSRKNGTDLCARSRVRNTEPKSLLSSLLRKLIFTFNKKSRTNGRERRSKPKFLGGVESSQSARGRPDVFEHWSLWAEPLANGGQVSVYGPHFLASLECPLSSLRSSVVQTASISWFRQSVLQETW